VLYRYDALGNATERREGVVNGPRHLLHERDGREPLDGEAALERAAQLAGAAVGWG
jgi:hypothetical protein